MIWLIGFGCIAAAVLCGVGIWLWLERREEKRWRAEALERAAERKARLDEYHAWRERYGSPAPRSSTRTVPLMEPLATDLALAAATVELARNVSDPIPDNVDTPDPPSGAGGSFGGAGSSGEW